MTRTLADAEIEIGQLRAEVERLREALERIAVSSPRREQRQIARAALNPQEAAE